MTCTDLYPRVKNHHPPSLPFTRVCSWVRQVRISVNRRGVVYFSLWQAEKMKMKRPGGHCPVEGCRKDKLFPCQENKKTNNTQKKAQNKCLFYDKKQNTSGSRLVIRSWKQSFFFLLSFVPFNANTVVWEEKNCVALKINICCPSFHLGVQTLV